MKEPEDPPKPKKRKKSAPRVRQRQEHTAATDPEPAAKENPVGYGNPPVHSRWVEGQSGNPTGRKKGAKNYKTRIYEAGQKEVTLKIQGETCRMSLEDVMINKLWEKGAQGDIKAFQILSTFIQQVETERTPPAVERERFENLMFRFLATCAAHGLDWDELALQDYEFDLDIAETAIEKVKDFLARKVQSWKPCQEKLEEDDDNDHDEESED